MNFPRFPYRQTLTFPFGFKVRINVVSKERLGRHIKDAKAVWIHEGDGGRILILKDDPYDEKMDSLTHELGHALTDYRGWLRLNFEIPFRSEQTLALAKDIQEADE